MMAWHRLTIGLIILSLSFSLLDASKKKFNKLQEDGMLEEQKSNTYCPEFCTCVRKNGDGVIAKCEKITATQQFDDRYSDFKLFSDSGNTEEAINLDDRFFIHLQMKSIQSIAIIDIAIKSIDMNAFRGLHNLVLVNLTNNGLEKIHQDTFATNKNMRQLSLSGNPLEFYDTNAYSFNTPYLQELDLSSCQLTSLTSKLFSKLTLMTYLNLESNNLDAIDSDTFWNLTALEEINLSNNNIHSLKQDLFIYNEALEHLVLRNNPLVTVENILLPGVTYLDLSFCHFAQISGNSFNGALGTTNLNLSHNAIAEISVDAFVKIPRLAYLDLSSNSLITPLDENVFATNNKLETLTLKDNPKMKLLPADGFKGSFEEFFKLNVANCGIESLTAGSFKNFPNLSQLDLSRNSLTSLKDDAILSAEVKHLNLAFNRITDLNDIHFPEKSQLRKLSLAGNKIKYLQTHFFDNLQFLTSLDVSNCEMEQIWQNQLDELHTLPKLNTINLSGNQLKKITKRDLEVFNNLQLLNVNKNPLSCGDDLNALINYLYQGHIGQFETQTGQAGTDRSWQDLPFTLNCLKSGLVNSPAIRMSNYDKDDHIKLDETDEDYYEYDEGEEGEEDEEEEETHAREDLQPSGAGKTSDPYGGKLPQLHMSGSSFQLVVMLLAAVTTFVVIVALVVSVILCRSRMLLHRENMAKRRGHRLNVYKPLFDHEHLNSPTTPIMKAREISVALETKEISTVTV